MTGYVMDDTIYPVIGIFLIERRNKDEHQKGK